MLVAVGGISSFRLGRGVLCQDVEEWAGQFPCRGEREWPQYFSKFLKKVAILKVAGWGFGLLLSVVDVAAEGVPFSVAAFCVYLRSFV